MGGTVHPKMSLTPSRTTGSELATSAKRDRAGGAGARDVEGAEDAGEHQQHELGLQDRPVSDSEVRGHRDPGRDHDGQRDEGWRPQPGRATDASPSPRGAQDRCTAATSCPPTKNTMPVIWRKRSASTCHRPLAAGGTISARPPSAARTTRSPAAGRRRSWPSCAGRGMATAPGSSAGCERRSRASQRPAGASPTAAPPPAPPPPAARGGARRRRARPARPAPTISSAMTRWKRPASECGHGSSGRTISRPAVGVGARVLERADVADVRLGAVAHQAALVVVLVRPEALALRALPVVELSW